MGDICFFGGNTNSSFSFSASFTVALASLVVVLGISWAYLSKKGTLPDEELLEDEVSEFEKEYSEEEVVAFDFGAIGSEFDDEEEAGFGSGRIEFRSFSFKDSRDVLVEDWLLVCGVDRLVEAVDALLDEVVDEPVDEVDWPIEGGD